MSNGFWEVVYIIVLGIVLFFAGSILFIVIKVEIHNRIYLNRRKITHFFKPENKKFYFRVAWDVGNQSFKERYQNAAARLLEKILDEDEDDDGTAGAPAPMSEKTTQHRQFFIQRHYREISKYLSDQEIEQERFQYLITRFGNDTDKDRYLQPFKDNDMYDFHTAHSDTDVLQMKRCLKFVPFFAPIDPKQREQWEFLKQRYYLFRESSVFDTFDMTDDLKDEEVDVFYGSAQQFLWRAKQFSLNNDFLVYVNITDKFQSPFQHLSDALSYLSSTKFDYYGDVKSNVLFLDALFFKNTYQDLRLKYGANKEKYNTSIIFANGKGIVVDITGESLGDVIDFMTRVPREQFELFNYNTLGGIAQEIKRLKMAGVLKEAPPDLTRYWLEQREKALLASEDKFFTPQETFRPEDKLDGWDGMKRRSGSLEQVKPAISEGSKIPEGQAKK